LNRSEIFQCDTLWSKSSEEFKNDGILIHWMIWGECWIHYTGTLLWGANSGWKQQSKQITQHCTSLWLYLRV